LFEKEDVFPSSRNPTDDYASNLHRRHPEVRALASLEGCCSAQCSQPSFEARKKERAPQDDGGVVAQGTMAVTSS
jgi:hypothetical protein